MTSFDFRKYVKKREFTIKEYKVVFQEYERLDRKINLLRHKQSKLVVKLQAHTVAGLPTP